MENIAGKIKYNNLKLLELKQKEFEKATELEVVKKEIEIIESRLKLLENYN